ncbi:MAG: TetR/AcrR family transcriptional regulator [Actinomycetota bacterium]
MGQPLDAARLDTARLDAAGLGADPAPRLPTLPESRRSRKKSKTRADLLTAGVRLFEANGFDETTTSDIAEQADVSQRTLFRHFETKEALLYGDMEDLQFELREALASRPTDEPILTMLRRVMLSLADNFDRNRDQRLLQARLAATYASVSAYSRAVVQTNWEREIIAAVADRLGVDPLTDPRPEIIAGATMSAIRNATRQWTASGGTADYLELIVEALEVIGTLGQLEQPVS